MSNSTPVDRLDRPTAHAEQHGRPAGDVVCVVDDPVAMIGNPRATIAARTTATAGMCVSAMASARARYSSAVATWR